MCFPFQRGSHYPQQARTSEEIPCALLPNDPRSYPYDPGERLIINTTGSATYDVQNDTFVQLSIAAECFPDAVDLGVAGAAKILLG